MTAPQYIPNKEIDKAIKNLLAGIDKNTPPDTACKIVAVAISWEKTKMSATRPRQFDPDELDA